MVRLKLAGILGGALILQKGAAFVPHIGSKLESTLRSKSCLRVATVQQQTNTDDTNTIFSLDSNLERAKENNAASLFEAEKDTDGEVELWEPKFLPWVKSQIEEDREINFYVNIAFLAVIGITVLAATVGPTLDVARGWTAEEVLYRLPRDNWDSYLHVLREYPIPVKAATSGVVYALGDWTAQTTNGVTLPEIDRWRILKSSVAGFIAHGPLSHFWYGICEAAFTAIGWNSAWWVFMPKVVVDQLLWGPLWTAIYIALLGVFSRDSSERIWEAVQSTLIPLVIKGLKLWPLVHVITYAVIPEENRLLWVDTVEILWVTILSKQAAEEAKRTGVDGGTGH